MTNFKCLAVELYAAQYGLRLWGG